MSFSSHRLVRFALLVGFVLVLLVCCFEASIGVLAKKAAVAADDDDGELEDLDALFKAVKTKTKVGDTKKKKKKADKASKKKAAVEEPEEEAPVSVSAKTAVADADDDDSEFENLVKRASKKTKTTKKKTTEKKKAKPGAEVIVETKKPEPDNIEEEVVVEKKSTKKKKGKGKKKAEKEVEAVPKEEEVVVKKEETKKKEEVAEMPAPAAREKTGEKKTKKKKKELKDPDPLINAILKRNTAAIRAREEEEAATAALVEAAVEKLLPKEEVVEEHEEEKEEVVEKTTGEKKKGGKKKKGKKAKPAVVPVRQAEPEVITLASKQRAQRAALANQLRRTMQAEVLAKKRFNKFTSSQDSRLAKLKARREKQDKLADKRAILEREIVLAQPEGARRLEWMWKATTASHDGVIAMNTGDVQDMLVASPRPYVVFLSFTALTSFHSCPMCHTIDRKVRQLSMAHHNYRLQKGGLQAYLDLLNSTSSTALISADGADGDVNDSVGLPVFFVNVDFHRNGDLFKTLRLTTAPSAIVVPAKQTVSRPPVNHLLTRSQIQHQFNTNQEQYPMNLFQDFLDRFVHYKVDCQDKGEPPSLGQAALGLLMLISLGLTLYLCKDFVFRLREFRNLLFFTSLSLYTFCISGGMYNILQNTPWYGVGENGEKQFIHSYNRAQFGVGGFIYGGLNSVISLMLIIFLVLVESDRVPIKNLLLRLALLPFSPGICIIVSALAWYVVLRIFTFKQNNYNMGMFAIVGGSHNNDYM